MILISTRTEKEKATTTKVFLWYIKEGRVIANFSKGLITKKRANFQWERRSKMYRVSKLYIQYFVEWTILLIFRRKKRGKAGGAQSSYQQNGFLLSKVRWWTQWHKFIVLCVQPNRRHQKEMQRGLFRLDYFLTA